MILGPGCCPVGACLWPVRQGTQALCASASSSWKWAGREPSVGQGREGAAHLQARAQPGGAPPGNFPAPPVSNVPFLL